MDINDIVDQLRVLVNDRYLVLPGQVLRQRKAHFARAHDDDSHGSSLIISRGHRRVKYRCMEKL